MSWMKGEAGLQGGWAGEPQLHCLPAIARLQGLGPRYSAPSFGSCYSVNWMVSSEARLPYVAQAGLQLALLPQSRYN